MKPDYKLVAKAKYIHMTADLASEVWQRGLQTLFPRKAAGRPHRELAERRRDRRGHTDNDVNYFLVFLGSSLIGYFAWKMENTSLHLLHLYLKPEYRGKAIGRDIVASCERLARGEGRGRVWCGVNAKALPVQQFFKARGYRSLGPAESEGGIERNELIFERML
ncbi:MAG: GNAT family N-acetyltransferase [Faecalibacterium prausnitzii]